MRPHGPYDNSGFDRSYRRGAIMGLTVAEAFILVCFCLLLLLFWWQQDTEKRSLLAADRIAEMTQEEKARLLRALGDGSLDLAIALGDAGVPVGNPVTAREYSRFLAEEDLRRMMKGLVELPQDVRLEFADLVEAGQTAQLAQAVARVSASDPLNQISARVGAAAAAEQQLTEALEQRLGAAIRGAGGQIDAEGTITLPDTVLFDLADDRVKDRAFLEDFCRPWIETLRGAGLDISEVKIEGHASSEGSAGSTPQQAYIYNLDLSQRRARNALAVCLAGLPEDAQTWAREHLVSVGYSSTRLVTDEGGAEDRQKSRRVMFSVAADRSGLLDDIERDLEAAGSPPAAGGAE